MIVTPELKAQVDKEAKANFVPYLADRYIARQIAKEMQLNPLVYQEYKGEQWIAAGIAYPTFTLDGQKSKRGRWKNQNRKKYGGDKYRWLGKKGQPKPELYHYPDIKKYVALAGGKIYLVGGEPDVWAMLTMGIYNVIAFLGEGNIPASFIDDLHNLGATEVIHLPNVDDAGIKSALRTRLKLDNSGIIYHAVLLPEKDVNDVLIAHAGNRAAAWEAIEQSPALELDQYSHLLPQKPVKQDKATYTKRNLNYTGIDYDQEYLNWVNNVVIPALDRQYPEKAGQRKCPNPAHGKQTGKTPPFRIDKKGIPQCHCGAYKTKPYDQIAEWLGVQSWLDYKAELRGFIDYADEKAFWEQKNARKNAPIVPDNNAPVTHKKGALSLATKEYILTHYCNESGEKPKRKTSMITLLRLWDVLLKAGFADSPFTIDQAVKAAEPYELAKSTVYRLITQKYTFSQIGNIYIPLYFIDFQNEKKSKGRNAAYYLLPDLSDYAAAFRVNPYEHDPLPDHALESNAAYREEIIYQNTSELKQQTRLDIYAQKVGASNSTACKLTKALKEKGRIEIEPNITRKDVSLDDLKTRLDDIASDVKKSGAVAWLELYIVDENNIRQPSNHKKGNNRIPLKLEAILRFCQEACFTLCVRSSNSYKRVTTPSDEPLFNALDNADLDFAEKDKPLEAAPIEEISPAEKLPAVTINPHDVPVEITPAPKQDKYTCEQRKQGFNLFSRFVRKEAKTTAPLPLPEPRIVDMTRAHKMVILQNHLFDVTGKDNIADLMGDFIEKHVSEHVLLTPDEYKKQLPDLFTDEQKKLLGIKAQQEARRDLMLVDAELRDYTIKSKGILNNIENLIIEPDQHVMITRQQVSLEKVAQV